jgi:hypothetical protein
LPVPLWFLVASLNLLAPPALLMVLLHRPQELLLLRPVRTPLRRVRALLSRRDL